MSIFPGGGSPSPPPPRPAPPPPPPPPPPKPAPEPEGKMVEKAQVKAKVEAERGKGGKQFEYKARRAGRRGSTLNKVSGGGLGRVNRPTAGGDTDKLG